MSIDKFVYRLASAHERVSLFTVDDDTAGMKNTYISVVKEIERNMHTKLLPDIARPDIRAFSQKRSSRITNEEGLGVPSKHKHTYAHTHTHTHTHTYTHNAKTTTQKNIRQFLESPTVARAEQPALQHNAPQLLRAPAWNTHTPKKLISFSEKKRKKEKRKRNFSNALTRLACPTGDPLLRAFERRQCVPHDREYLRI